MPHVPQQRMRETAALRPAAQRGGEGRQAPASSPLLQAQAQLREKMAASPRVAAQRAVQPSREPVIQGWWVTKGVPEGRKETVHAAARDRPVRGFIALLQELHETDSLVYLARYEPILLGPEVGDFLARTYGDETDGFNYRYLFQQVEKLVQENAHYPAIELRGETDDADHPEGSAAEETTIDWSDLTPQGIGRLPPATLKNIFADLVRHHFNRAGAQPQGFDLNTAFGAWMHSGVRTRAQFKRLIGLQDSATYADAASNDIIQFARSGNSYSQQDAYQGSQGFNYRNVIYYRDGQGNINFGANPAGLRAAYNTAYNATIAAGDIKWTNPVRGGSHVQMSQDLKDPKKGVMPSGKQVDLGRASRSQHFAIANMLSAHQNGGGWTWHHLTPRYEMVLVDTRVHSKHGHNGGVYLW